MSQKVFVHRIALIVVIILLGGIGTYFVLNRQTQPTLISGVPTAGPNTVRGEITCLPKKGTGPQTFECAIGVKGIDGRYYGLKNLFKLDPEYKFSVGGMHVEVSGTFIPDEMKGSDSNTYDVVGTIDMLSIKEIKDGR